MVTRINGLSSGMDIDATVKKLMQARRVPLDKLMQKRQTIQWQQDDYRTMNSKILDLKNNAFNMKLQSSYLAKKVTSSNESVVSATASPSAISGSYTMKVDRLAKAASLTSTGTIGTPTTTVASTIQSVFAAAPVLTQLRISGEKGTSMIEVNNTDTIASFISNFNGKSSITGVTVSFDDTIKKFFFSSSGTGNNAKAELDSTQSTFMSGFLQIPITTTGLTGANYTGSVKFTTPLGAPDLTQIIKSDLAAPQTFRINYVGKPYDFTVSSSTSVGSLITSINSSDLGKNGVFARLAATGELILTSPDTNPLTFSDQTPDSTDIVTTLGLNASVGVNFTYDQVKNAGLNSQVWFNGVYAEYSSNTFSISGINFTANKADPGTYNVNVSQDVDTVYNSIKSFVDKYNETIGLVNSKISEERYKKYIPLTDDQKTAMKDADIKLWEDKAKSGLLRNDSILSQAVSTFRSNWYESVSGLPSGNYKQLSDVGITTLEYSEKGKLHINETKLKEAISKNPEQVMSLFLANDNSTSSSGKGVALRIYDAADQTLSQLKTRAGSSTAVTSSFELGKQMLSVNKGINSWNSRLIDIENNYYKQFTAMEKALTKYNSQSAALSQFAAK